ncbi:MAG TPA: hypothetical protein VKZ49_12345 [Polyangiaceae bacterium]|nr:hypothetical protein [Polyangiaceae bacterium]
MRRPPTRGLWAALVAAGCAATSQVTAPVDDYQAYRQVRLATSAEQRLAASWRYLRAHPNGQWQGEVAAWFQSAERSFRDAARDRPDLLQRYLALMPDAPAAREVEQRLEELKLASAYRKQREAEFAAKARQFEAELQRAAEDRKELLRWVARWVQRLSSIDAWGEPLEALPPSLLEALAAEGASCGEQGCAARVTRAYAVPYERRLIARQATADLLLRVDGGQVVGAELGGPALFSRIGEAAQVRGDRFDDAQARAEAIGHVVQLLQSALYGRLRAPECAREAVSPVVLHWECGGISVQAVASEQPTGNDRVLFTRAAPPSNP